MRSILVNKKITLFVLVVLVLASFYSYFQIPKQESPNLTAPYAIITTVYPGASIETIEKDVTSRVERELFGITGYEYSTSYTSNNVSVVVLAIDFDADLEKAYIELADKMSTLQEELPDGCQGIDINDSIMDTSGLIISLSSDNYSYEELSMYANQVNEKIGRIKGIQRFEVMGSPIKQVEVIVNEEKRAQLGLSYEDLSRILLAQTVNIPLGTIIEEEQKIQLSYDPTIQSLTDLENFIIGVIPELGTPLYLKDIASVTERYSDTNYRFVHNGKKAVILAGYFQKNQNVLTIGKEVETTIEELRKTLPSDLKFDEVSYLPEAVAKSINDFLMNLALGVLLVIFVVFIGMGLRNAIIVSVAIPVSILLTVLSMPLFNIQIHQISIAACIVALGMLVDNAIVVSDAIQVKIDEGTNQLDSCVEGTKMVLVPVLTSTLTTIAAFTPLLFLQSIAGEYVKALPQIVIISLVVSYGVAVLITPTLAYIFFKPTKGEKNRRYRLRKFFAWLLENGLKRSFIAFAFILVFTGFAVFIGLQLDVIFFPKVEKDVLYMDIDVLESQSLDETETFVEDLMARLSEEKAIDYYTIAIGSGLPRFYDTLNVYTPIENFAQVYMKVSRDQEKFVNNTAYLEYLQETIDAYNLNGDVVVKQLEYIDPRGSIIGVRISGDSTSEVDAITANITKELKGIEGTMNVSNTASPYVDSMKINVDANAIAKLGLMNYTIQNEINIALMGRGVGILPGEINRSIILKSSISDKAGLEKMMFKTGETTSTFNTFGTIDNISSKGTYKKYDGKYSVYVGSDVISGFDRTVILDELKEILKDVDLKGVKLQYEGENEKIKEYFGDMGILAIYALFMIYLILLIQFRSFNQPLIILSTIPLATIGSVLGLFIFKQPISFTAGLGIVSLMGIVVNNAIVLLDFIKLERQQGKTIHEACIDAVQLRFRPIMLSTITTIIGLMPLAFGKGDLFRPMAIALMSGLSVSTILTLVVIPIIYGTFVKETFVKKV